MLQKPAIPDDMIAKWQRIIDILARLLEVPSGLIMKTEAPKHFVYISSEGDNNPYETGGEFELETGLYCDNVIQNEALLIVDDATRYPRWENNPDMKHDMLFYMGLPLMWPDGDIFGTICVLDTKVNPQAMQYVNLLKEFGGVVNTDLKFLVELSARKAAQHALLDAQDQLEQRVERRTKQLLDANQSLQKEIKIRRKAEKSVLKREAKLEESNTALRVLLEHMESSRGTIEEQIFSTINTQITPYIDKLKQHTTNDSAFAFAEIIEANINELTAPLNKHLSSVFAKLTPTEIEIAKLVIQSKSTKVIADILNVATSTVDFHRNNIRKKVGIKNSRMNLRSFLNSLS